MKHRKYNPDTVGNLGCTGKIQARLSRNLLMVVELTPAKLSECPQTSEQSAEHHPLPAVDPHVEELLKHIDSNFLSLQGNFSGLEAKMQAHCIDVEQRSLEEIIGDAFDERAHKKLRRKQFFKVFLNKTIVDTKIIANQAERLIGSYVEVFPGTMRVRLFPRHWKWSS